MKKILVTGFGPFSSHTNNPTEHLAKALDGQIAGDYKIHGRVLPVSHKDMPLELSKRMLETRPDAVLGIGLAADRTEITPELVAINYFHSQEPDNDGETILERKLYPQGPPAYFCTFPARQIAEALQQKEIPARVSTTAGTFVCNQNMYELGKRFDNPDKKTPWGFIHVPANLTQDVLAEAVRTAVKLM